MNCILTAAVLLAVIVPGWCIIHVQSKEPELSDSYIPVAVQIIDDYLDQLRFSSKSSFISRNARTQRTTRSMSASPSTTVISPVGPSEKRTSSWASSSTLFVDDFTKSQDITSKSIDSTKNLSTSTADSQTKSGIPRSLQYDTPQHTSYDHIPSSGPPITSKLAGQSTPLISNIRSTRSYPLKTTMKPSTLYSTTGSTAKPIPIANSYSMAATGVYGTSASKFTPTQTSPTKSERSIDYIKNDLSDEVTIGKTSTAFSQLQQLVRESYDRLRNHLVRKRMAHETVDNQLSNEVDTIPNPGDLTNLGGSFPLDIDKTNYLQRLYKRTTEPGKMLVTGLKPFFEENTGSTIRIEESEGQKQLQELYESLIRESKHQGLQNYAGSSQKVMADVATSSSQGAINQLKVVLQKLLDHGNAERPSTKTQVQKAITDLSNADSSLSVAIQSLTPLTFSV